MISKLLSIALIYSLILTCFAVEQSIVRPEKVACIVPCQNSQFKQSQNGQKITILTFYVEQEIEQAQDFIQMSLTIKQKDNSLKKAVEKATRKVQSIKKSCQDYCVKNKAQNCDGRVQVDNFKVEAAYQTVRREPIFNGFVVTHKIKIVVLQTQNVGELVDIILNLGIYQIDELEWKPNVQVDVMEKAIDAGIYKGNELCQHINRKMGAILSINQIFDEDQDENNGDQEEDGGKSQDQDEDQQQPSVLKFQVQCVGSTVQQIKIKDEEKTEKSEKSEKKKKKKQKK